MKKRRFRSPHPGIKFKKRKCSGGQFTYTALWPDPDDHRMRSVSLDSLGLTNEEQRRAWAVNKSREIQQRRQELSGGAPKRTSTEMNAAIDRFLTEKSLEIRPRTIEIYGECIERFRRWTEAAGIRIAEHLAPHHLPMLRTYLLGLPKRFSKKGGKRGQREDRTERRSPTSINRDLRSIKTLLHQWRRCDLTPLLNSDHLADRLQYVRESKNLKTFLMQDGLAKLLSACQRHDAVMFDETRAEHAGIAPVGSTPRYYEITPFTLTVLLTGCRLGEVRRLQWRHVVLEQNYIALDDGAGVKTGMGRRISLEETPLLAFMLSAMKLRAGPTPYVFGGPTELSEEVADNCRARLLREFEAPHFSWQMLRRTCGTFLSCASGIKGAGSAWLSAARLGHGIDVAQKHYLGVLNNIPVEAKSLEAAMEIENEMRAFIQRRFGLTTALQQGTGKWAASS